MALDAEPEHAVQHLQPGDLEGGLSVATAPWATPSAGAPNPAASPASGPSAPAAAPALGPGSAVVAIGGNALERGADDDAWRLARATAAQLADLVAAGAQLIITHGNGPQVGRALRRAALAEAETGPLPIATAVAQTQGEIGFQLARSLADALRMRGIDRPVGALVTQVVVDAEDPAFAAPDKPIGEWMNAERSRRMARTRGWRFVHDATLGHRRVVASPTPLAVLELPLIRAMVADGAIVVAGGGGGIPVAAVEGRYEGVPAVVDKDLTSALLASGLGVERLFIVTGVPHVMLDYGTPHERAVHRLTAGEAAEYLAAGQFPAGSMGPKITAAVAFVTGAGGAPGAIATITDIDHIAAAWRGEAGTQVVA
ncbi:MAG: carbamate kinase [Ardenticatenales bacterium]